jgi:hypothetical protein
MFCRRKTMKILYLCIIFLYASGSMAVNLKEFQATVARGEAAQIRTQFDDIMKSDSPELLMRARSTLMSALPASPQRDAMMTQALEKTLTLTAATPKDTMWVANAHYIKAQTLTSAEQQFNHLKQATLLGHDKAPEEMALLIAKKQPDKARDLLTLSLMRGNYHAAATYAKLDGSHAKKAELVRILEEMAAKGDTRARRTLNEIRKEPI